MVAVNGIGSTNDSIAWDMCDTGQSFKEGRLNPRHHFMGDDAYTSCEQMLVPYSGKNLTSAQDAYNFAQSSVRIENLRSKTHSVFSKRDGVFCGARLRFH